MRRRNHNFAGIVCLGHRDKKNAILLTELSKALDFVFTREFEPSHGTFGQTPLIVVDSGFGHRPLVSGPTQPDEAVASRAVFVIVSWWDGSAETLLEPVK